MKLYRLVLPLYPDTQGCFQIVKDQMKGRYPEENEMENKKCRMLRDSAAVKGTKVLLSYKTAQNGRSKDEPEHKKISPIGKGQQTSAGWIISWILYCVDNQCPQPQPCRMREWAWPEATSRFYFQQSDARL